MSKKPLTRRQKIKNFLTNPLGNSGYNFHQEIPFLELEQFKDHRRLTVFYHKGTECANPKCNRIGTRLICGIDPFGNLHWDIYTEDLVMMTVDHIMPRSKGGGEELNNKNPMCRYCNTNKSDKIQDIYLKNEIQAA